MGAQEAGNGVPTTDQVLKDLDRILVEVVGDDLLLDEPLSMETSFNDDLQLESIEFVALAEELLNTYGERVDFVNWMAGMELDDVVALTAGDVVNFVVRSLSEG
jgi:acyl carrier protein